MSKRRAREVVDKAQDVAPRGSGSRSNTRHPSQRGGIKADLNPAQMRQYLRGGKRPSHLRSGLFAHPTLADAPAGRSRTGKSRDGMVHDAVLGAVRAAVGARQIALDIG